MEPIAAGVTISAITQLLPRKAVYVIAAVGAFFLIRPTFKRKRK